MCDVLEWLKLVLFVVLVGIEVVLLCDVLEWLKLVLFVVLVGIEVVLLVV